jgi:acetyl-CoA carboxylase carboxyl transferase subunit beta
MDFDMAWYKRENSDEDLTEEKRSVPVGVWTKCPGCRAALLTADLEKNDLVCPQCDHHFPLPSARRLELTLDPGSFEEADRSIESVDPLGFRDSQKYGDRLRTARRSAGGADAIRVGAGRIEGQPVEVGVFVFEFMGGSMGSVVGEKVTRLYERALERRVPAVVFSASGGARMQEGVLSLMQMAKTSAALGRLREAGLPYISVLLHPTTGGVAASFAMLGDVILAEPKALIGFAGARVIQNTIRQRLPAGFQRAEFLLEHGFLDTIIPRREMRATLAKLLRLLGPKAA